MKPKPSIEKLQKFFKHEASRGYDNKAVMGGLSGMLSKWEAEARHDKPPAPDNDIFVHQGAMIKI